MCTEARSYKELKLYTLFNKCHLFEREYVTQIVVAPYRRRDTIKFYSKFYQEKDKSFIGISICN